MRVGGSRRNGLATMKRVPLPTIYGTALLCSRKLTRKYAVIFLWYESPFFFGFQIVWTYIVYFPGHHDRRWTHKQNMCGKRPTSNTSQHFRKLDLVIRNLSGLIAKGHKWRICFQNVKKNRFGIIYLLVRWCKPSLNELCIRDEYFFFEDFL